MASHFRVNGPRALVKRIENSLQSHTIEVIQYQAEPSMFAVVLAVGPGEKLDNGRVLPMDVKQNDVVIIKKLCGTPVFVNGESCQIVMREDLLAVVDL